MPHGDPQSLPLSTTYWGQLRTIWGCFETFIKTAEVAEAAYFLCSGIAADEDSLRKVKSDPETLIVL